MNALELALNKLAKWRTVFASWQLGTRPKGEPECDAVRDHREATIMLRAEVSALIAVLIRRKAFTAEEFQAALAKEAELLDRDYERRFPGFRTHQFGIDIDMKEAAETMKGWRP